MPTRKDAKASNRPEPTTLGGNGAPIEISLSAPPPQRGAAKKPATGAKKPKAKPAPLSQAELIRKLEAIVEDERVGLGADFAQFRGEFWGWHETRPYMRARLDLALVLTAAGRNAEAIAHMQDMLKLNPGDNQGVRQLLLGELLAAGRAADAGKLLRQYKDEGSAWFAWGGLLWTLLDAAPGAKGVAAARKQLAEARAANPFLEAYLVGAKPLPKRSPSFHGFGDEREAQCAAESLLPAWRAHPAALAWLKAEPAAAPAEAKNPAAK